MVEIDNYLLDELRLRQDEKGALARMVIQLKIALDNSRRTCRALESELYRVKTSLPVAEYQYRFRMADWSPWSDWISIPEVDYRRMWDMHNNGQHEFRELCEKPCAGGTNQCKEGLREQITLPRKKVERPEA